MRDTITPTTIANEIKMARGVHSRVCLLVEGSDDIKLYTKLIHSSVIFFECFGREQIIEVLRAIDSHRYGGVIAIADADYCRLLELCWFDERVFLTDFHDSELMVLASIGFKDFINEFCSPGKVAMLDCDVLRTTIALAKYIGLLRFLSLLSEWNLTFKGIDYYKFVNQKTFSIDIDKMIRCVYGNTKAPSASLTEISSAYSCGDVDKYNPFELCCGHDVVSLLGIGLRNKFATRTLEKTDPIDIAKVLRLSFGLDVFESTRLWRELHCWESRHEAFQLLR